MENQDNNYQVDKQLLSLDSISNIQKRLKEYRSNIQYVVEFILKSQRHIENHLKAIQEVANSLLLNDTQTSMQHNNPGIGRHSQQNNPIYFPMVNIFKEAISEIIEYNPVFQQDSAEFIEHLNKECKLAKESIQIYKEHEKEFLSQLKQYKAQSKETQQKIDEYKSCLNDPKLLYNPKEKQIKWYRVEKEYALLGNKENNFFDTLELIQTKKKALGINLQELMAKNQRGLFEIIKTFILYILKSSSSFIVFFFFYSTYLHEKSLRHNKYVWNPEIIPPPHSYSSKSLPFQSQNKYPNFLYAHANMSDQQLIEFSDYAKIYINDIEKQSLSRQNEVSLSLKFLESLKGYYDGCSKRLKEMQTKFDMKAKQSIQYLMGKDTSLEINVLMNNIEIASSQIIKHSRIVSAQYEMIKQHLYNLKECHQRVFSGLNKSLFDHNRIRDEFKIVILYQSQYQYTSSPHNHPQGKLFYSQQNQQQQQQLNYSQYSSSNPNFQIIKKKIADSIPALQDCMIFFLQDYEKINTKEINQIREGLNKVVIQIEKSCKDMISEQEKVEQNRGSMIANIEENSPQNFALSPNLMNKINENAISKYLQQLLSKDECFKLFYSDLNEEIEKLQIDFTREKYFNHGQISSLEAPSKSNQLVQLKRASTFQEQEESFVSFQSFSDEEEKTANNFPEQYRDQAYSNNNLQSNKQQSLMSSYQKNGDSTSNLDETLQQSQVVYQDSTQLQKQQSKVKVTKKELLEQEEFIKKRLQWNLGEELKHHFSCAFAQNINLQGRIYITNQRLIFQSYFNGNTIFFNETLLEIPKSDILHIHKKKNMLSFDNAIQIDVVKGNLLFTQFIYRDDAYNAILNVLQPVNMINQLSSSQRTIPKDIKSHHENIQSQREVPNSLQSIQEDGEETNSGEKQQQQISQRRQNIEYVMKQTDSFKYELGETIFKGENLTIKDIYQSCLGDFAYTHPENSQGYQNYFSYYIENIMKCWNIKIEKWSPPPPAYFLDQTYQLSEDQAKKQEKIQDWIEISQREVNYDKAIPLSGMLFLPKSCQVSEKQKLMFISPDELVFELEAYSSGAPMTDSFYHVIRNRFVQLTPDTVSYKVQMDVRFLKSNWLSGTIESQSFKEGQKSTKDIIKCFSERIQTFLLEKQELKKKQSINEISAVSDNKSLLSSNKKGAKTKSDFMQEMNTRQQSILSSLEPMDKYKNDIFDMQFNDPINGLSVQEVFRVLFDDSQHYEGYSDIYEYMKITKFNDTNYSATHFTPKIPLYIYQNKVLQQSDDNSAEFIDRVQDVLQSPHFSEREIQFTHLLPPNNIPFLPKDCQVKEKIKVYWVSDQMIIMNIEGFTTGIPKGEYFCVRVRYLLTQVDANTVHLQQKSYVHFFQSIFLQSKIENSTIEQQHLSSHIYKPLFKEIVANYIANKKQALLKSEPATLSRQTTSHQKTQGISTAETRAAIENRKRRILSQMETNDKFKITLINHTFNYQDKHISLFSFFNLFYSDTQPCNNYSDFYEYLKKGCIGDQNYKSTLYSPPIPHYFSEQSQKNDEELLCCPDYSERQITFIHALPQSNIPFMPKSCNIKEVIKVYWVSNDMIVVNLEAFTSGVMKGDTFTVRVRSIFKQVDEKNIQMTQQMHVNFIENTLISGKIESNTIEQLQMSVNDCVLPTYKDLFNKHFSEITQHHSQLHQQVADINQNQYNMHRIKSIQVLDDNIDCNSLTDNGSFKQRSIKKFKHDKHNQEYQTPQKEQKDEQIVQLNQNINQMNERIKLLIIGFVIIYISTLLFMVFNK